MTHGPRRTGRLVRHYYQTDGAPKKRLEGYEQAVLDARSEGDAPPDLSEHMAEKFDCQTVEDFIIPAGWEIVQTDWNTDTGEAWVTFFVPDGG